MIMPITPNMPRGWAASCRSGWTCSKERRAGRTREPERSRWRVAFGARPWQTCMLVLTNVGKTYQSGVLGRSGEGGCEVALHREIRLSHKDVCNEHETLETLNGCSRTPRNAGPDQGALQERARGGPRDAQGEGHARRYEHCLQGRDRPGPGGRRPTSR